MLDFAFISMVELIPLAEGVGAFASCQIDRDLEDDRGSPYSTGMVCVLGSSRSFSISPFLLHRSQTLVVTGSFPLMHKSTLLKT